MKFIKKNKLFRNFIFNNISKSWAKDKYQRIKPYLNQDDKILDLGAGKCALSWFLQQNNYQVTAVDVQNLSLCPEIEPIIYDGKKLPFVDDSFDVGLLLTVLHHTPKPKAVLEEIKRVCKEIIIIEDVYYNPVQKYLTYFTDSLFNFEFIGHPHSNKTDKEWQKVFKELNLNLKDRQSEQVLKFFTQITYHLNRD